MLPASGYAEFHKEKACADESHALHNAVTQL